MIYLKNYIHLLKLTIAHKLKFKIILQKASLLQSFLCFLTYSSFLCGKIYLKFCFLNTKLNTTKFVFCFKSKSLKVFEQSTTNLFPYLTIYSENTKSTVTVYKNIIKFLEIF